MKGKILLKSFIALALIATFSVGQADASEVTGTLSSSNVTNQQESDDSGTLSGTVGGGSDDSGTLSGTVGGDSDTGTLGGTVTGGSSGSSSSSSGGGSSGGSVLGANTSGGNTSGSVLGVSTQNFTPGFPNTGLESEVNHSAISLIGLILSVVVLAGYAYHRRRINV